MTPAEVERYIRFYRTAPGRGILEAEAHLCLEHLGDCRRIISVGCGPAMVEVRMRELAPHIEITGVDLSKEMLEAAPSTVRTVLADAGALPFPDGSFDGLMLVTFLEFAQEPEKAIEEGYRVLIEGGRLISLVLNPESHYCRERVKMEGSYIEQNMRNHDVKDMERMLRPHFDIDVHFASGVRGEEIFDTEDRQWASVLSMRGFRRKHGN